jgi:hypothetical protein
VGREYRLSRDARLREEGDRRDARIRIALRRQIHPVDLSSAGAIAGIDVGEDYLDIALIQPGDAAALNLSRVDLRGIHASRDAPGSAIGELARRIAKTAPQLNRGAVAIIDSPRWPRDLDWSEAAINENPRPGASRITGREIDASLQNIVRRLRAAGATALKLSMFPTPKMAYFAGQLHAPSCKSHLLALGRELFPSVSGSTASPVGGSFTRFMLSGFAAYRALTACGVTCYEGYPDLQFRLWLLDRDPESVANLPSKMGKVSRAVALDARRRVATALATRLRIRGAKEIRTLDQADAAVMALSGAATRREACGLLLAHPSEGSFWLTIPARVSLILPLDD